MTKRVDGDVTALSNFCSLFVLGVLGGLLLLALVPVLVFVTEWRTGLVFAFFYGGHANRVKPKCRGTSLTSFSGRIRFRPKMGAGSQACGLFDARTIRGAQRRTSHST